MLKSFHTIVLFLTAGLTSLPQLAQAQAVPRPEPAAAAPAPPQFLRDIPGLQQEITLEATDRPLGDVLADMSASLPVDLCAEQGIADQRVTLHLAGQPVYLVMDRLVRLLSHHPDALGGYHWGPLDHHTGARPVFQLWRDTSSRSEEQGERDYPRREMAVLLRDIRNLARMSPQEQSAYKSDDPYLGVNKLFTKAFKGLSDDQLDALLAGQKLPLDPAIFADEIAVEYREQARIQQAQRENKGYATTTAYGRDASPASPSLSVMPIIDTGVGGDLGIGSLPSTYVVFVNGLSGGIIIDTYDTNSNRSPDRLPHPSVPGPAVDLTSLLTAKGVTRAQHSDVGFTLQALARAAHINVYHEDFLRTSTKGASTDDSMIGLKMLKGTLPDIIDAICAHWNYRCQKVGDDYLFSSRTWAQDRVDDVPERLVSVWRGRIQKQGCLTLGDWGEIATSLSRRQCALTLAVALPEAGEWNSFNYEELRLIGQLPPDQRAAAFSKEGLSLGAVSSQQRQEMAKFFPTRLKNVSDDQVSQAVLTFETYSYMPGTQVVIMEAKLGGNILYATRCAIPIPFTPAPTTLAHPGSG